MTLPNSLSDYQFNENLRVKQGDPTKATDFNSLAQQTDWLREAKVNGWSNQAYGVNTLYKLRKNDTGVFWVSSCCRSDKAEGSGHDFIGKTLISCGKNSLLGSDGLKNRLLVLTFSVSASTGGELVDEKAEGFLPFGGEKMLDGDFGEKEYYHGGNLLGSDANPLVGSRRKTLNQLIRAEPLWAGNGEVVQKGKDVPIQFFRRFKFSLRDSSSMDVLFFWVDGDNGSLKYKWRTSKQNHGIALHGEVLYGPKWGSSASPTHYFSL